jgi:hypothetical protein
MTLGIKAPNTVPRAKCCKIASLTMSACVKPFSSARLHALKEERHFALVDGVAFSNRRLARNRFQVRTQSDPCISSVATAIMITTSNSPAKGERDTQSISRRSTAHHRDVRVVPRVN